MKKYNPFNYTALRKGSTKYNNSFMFMRNKTAAVKHVRFFLFEVFESVYMKNFLAEMCLLLDSL